MEKEKRWSRKSYLAIVEVEIEAPEELDTRGVASYLQACLKMEPEDRLVKMMVYKLE